VTAAPQGGSIKGTVKAGGVPLPGVAVTATNTLTGKKYATTTDVDGAFQMDVPRNGRYVVKSELTGFAPVTQEVVVNAASENGGLPVQTAEFKMDLASRVTPEPATATTTVARAGDVSTPAPGATPGTARRAAGATPGGVTPGAVARQGRTTQTLTVESGDNSDLTDATAGDATTVAESQMPTMAGLASGDDTSALSNDSIAVSGQQGQINGLAQFSQDELQNRIGNMQQNGFTNGDIAGALGNVMQSGTFGGPGGGPGGFGGPGGGGPGGGPGGGGGGGFGGGGGGRGGGGGGGFRGGGGGGGFGGPGGFRGQNPNAWHGTVGYSGYNNAINATPFSVSGIAIPKPDREQNALVASFTGTPYIPGLTTPNPKQFVFLSVQETHTSSPSTVQTLLPTPAQRFGDLTPSHQAGTPAGGTSSSPNTNVVYDPNTGQPYGNANCLPALYALYPTGSPITACIPATELNPAALALLYYYPQPNITSTESTENYQANFPGSSHASQVSARYNRSFGATPTRGARGGGGGGFGGRGGGGGGQNRNAPPTLRQSIAENFAYGHNASASQSFSDLLSGKSHSDNYSFTSQYTIGYGRFNNNASVGWNRSNSQTTNLFTNGTVNPAISADNNIPAPGIYVGNSSIYGNPFFYGVPGISITGGLAGLSDTSPSSSINQTITLSDSARWTHKRHNLQLGIDFHRIHNDSTGGGGVLGSFTFSGFSTENPLAQTCNPSTDSQKCTEYAPSGSSVADFLLGMPQNTNVTAGISKIYLRGNSWDWFGTDDWRAKSNLTFEYGLRWEYFSPYSEKNGHLVNLNVTNIGTDQVNATTVCASPAPAGSPASACASVQPGTLVKPDKSMFSPRISIAWTPKFKFTKNTVVRSGYGINYNTGQYSSFAHNLAYQQPFFVTQKNVQSSGGTSTGCTPQNMTLAHGFNCDSALTQSSYAVDPNYRLGMVQVYNLGIQRTLPQGVVLNIDYTGAYAGNLDMVRAPNRNAYGVIKTSVGQFNYEDSLGYQRSNALAVNVRERMHKGVALGATYTYSHSIDDASSVGGSGNSIAQNDQDLSAEESNSSFDRRHSLSGNFVIEPPFGSNRAFFNKGNITSKILDGFNISGNFNFASGGWATPSYSGTAQEIAAGANGLRPNRNYATPVPGKGSITSWFNPQAFIGACTSTNPNLPVGCLPPGQYGTASRNSIELPGALAVSASLSRTVSFGETRSLEFRFNASNVFNTVQYAGVYTQVNSSQFGQISSAAGMRAFTYNMRYRF
jgi:hypothetical protein